MKNARNFTKFIDVVKINPEVVALLISLNNFIFDTVFSVEKISARFVYNVFDKPPVNVVNANSLEAPSTSVTLPKINLFRRKKTVLRN